LVERAAIAQALAITGYNTTGGFSTATFNVTAALNRWCNYTCSRFSISGFLFHATLEKETE